MLISLMYVLIAAAIIFVILLLAEAGPKAKLVVWVLFAVFALLYIVHGSSLL